MNKPKVVRTKKRLPLRKSYTGVNNPTALAPGLSKEEYALLASLVGTAVINGDYDVLVHEGKSAEIYLRPTDVNGGNTASASALAALIEHKLADVVDGRIQANRGVVVAYTEAIWLGGEVVG
jgi:hypothetical protein